MLMLMLMLMLSCEPGLNRDSRDYIRIVIPNRVKVEQSRIPSRFNLRGPRELHSTSAIMSHNFDKKSSVWRHDAFLHQFVVFLFTLNRSTNHGLHRWKSDDSRFGSRRWLDYGQQEQTVSRFTEIRNLLQRLRYRRYSRRDRQLRIVEYGRKFL